MLTTPTTRLLKRIDQTFTTLFKGYIVTFFVLASLLFLFQMFQRFLFHSTYFWIDSLIGYLFTLSALGGAALATKSDENIKIDLLKKYNKTKAIKLIVLFFSSGVSVLIIYVFWGHFKVEWVRNEFDNFLPKWGLDLPYLFLFLGSFFYFFHNGWKLIFQSNLEPKEIE